MGLIGFTGQSEGLSGDGGERKAGAQAGTSVRLLKECLAIVPAALLKHKTHLLSI